MSEQQMTRHSRECDYVGWQQGYAAPPVCSCGFDQQQHESRSPAFDDAVAWCETRNRAGAEPEGA